MSRKLTPSSSSIARCSPWGKSGSRSVEQPPEACGTCAQPLAQDGKYLRCTNSSCPARVQGRISNWIDAVGALAWGEKLIATLVEEELVREPVDLYKLEEKDIARLAGHGEKSAKIALDQLPWLSGRDYRRGS